MEYTITEFKDKGIILLKVVGDVTRQEMLACDMEAHALGRQLGIRRYLMDATEAHNVESVTGNYVFIRNDIEREEIDRLARVAMLVAPDDHSHDFVETVARNSGFLVKLFRDRGEAERYLLE